MKLIVLFLLLIPSSAGASSHFNPEGLANMPSRNDVAFVAQRDGFNAAEQHQQGFADGVPSPTAASAPESRGFDKNANATQKRLCTKSWIQRFSPQHPDEGGCVPTGGVREKPAADGVLPAGGAAVLLCICVVLMEERFLFNIVCILGVRLATPVALLKRMSTLCFGFMCFSSALQVSLCGPMDFEKAQIAIALNALACVALYHDFWMKRNGFDEKVSPPDRSADIESNSPSKSV